MKDKAATIIQKYLRGFKLTKHLFLHIQQHKIEQNYDYFNSLRNNLVLYTVKKLQLIYLRNKYKRIEKQVADLQNLVQLQKKDKKDKKIKYKNKTGSQGKQGK